jgi:hypothetical protein
MERTMSSDCALDLVQHSSNAYDAVNAMCQITGGPLPPRLVYEALGNLTSMANVLPAVLNEFILGLYRALEPPPLDDTRAAGQAACVMEAERHLRHVVALASLMALELGNAQNAINRGMA